MSVPCCGNTYCKACVVQSLKSKKTCPICRKKVLVSQLRPVPRVVANILEKFSQNNCSNKESIVERKEDTIKFPVKTYPDYAMFGTFRSTPKFVEFTADGINLTNVGLNNTETKSKYHIMIPFTETQELLYYFDDTIILFFIKPTVQSNIKIQESMDLGKESTNGFKFDIKSEGLLSFDFCLKNNSFVNYFDD